MKFGFMTPENSFSENIEIFTLKAMYIVEYRYCFGENYTTSCIKIFNDKDRDI